MLRFPAPQTGLAMTAGLAMAICLVLAAAPASAQPAAGRLAPGKPAGLNQARAISDRSIFIGASVVLVALAFVLPASSTSSTATAAATTN